MWREATDIGGNKGCEKGAEDVDVDVDGSRENAGKSRKTRKKDIKRTRGGKEGESV